MRTHTANFKNEIKKFGREIDVDLYYYYHVGDVFYNYTDIPTDKIINVTPILHTELLKSVMKEINITSKVDIPIDDRIEIYCDFGIKTRNNNVLDYRDNYDYVNLGIYKVYSSEYDEVEEAYIIKAYDRMIYAMKEYTTLQSAEFPMTIREYISALCSDLSNDNYTLEFVNANDTFVNYDKVLETDPYANINYTYRDIFDDLSEVTASNICINNEDKLEIRYIKDASNDKTIRDSSIEITDGQEAKLQGLEIEGKTEQDDTPNPDYPSELESVGYENLAYLGSKVGNVRYLNNATSYNDYIFEPGTYTLNYNDSNTITTYIRGETDTSNISLGTSKTITFTKNEKFNLWFYRSGLTENEISNLQLVKGTKTYTYIPYGKYGIEVKTIGKNLFDGVYELGTINTTNGGLENNSSIIRTSNYINIKKSQNYVLSLPEQVTGIILYFYNNGNYLYYSQPQIVNHKVAFTNGVQPNQVKWRFNTGYTTLQNETMLEQGTQATEYEAYKKNTYLYTLDKPLRSIGNTKDLLYIKNGLLYVERKIGSVVLNGSETWKGGNYSSGSPDYVYLYASFIDTQINTQFQQYAKSNYFSSYSAVITSGISISNDCFSVGGADNKLRFMINKNYLNDLSSQTARQNSFKTWLSTHNTKVQYILDDSYTEELGQVQMPSTYEGTTYIDLTDGLNTNMVVTYVNEYDVIDEEYLKDINVKFGEKFGAINTIILSRSADSDKIARSIPDDLVDEDKIALTIKDNQIMNDDNRDEYIDGILNQLYGLEFYLNDFTSTGITYLEACDKYTVSANGNNYSCIMFNDEIDITQGLVENVYTEWPEKSETEYKYITPTDKLERTTSLIVDKVNSRITAQAEELEIITTNIDKTNGDIKSVTPVNDEEKHFVFNSEGLKIEDKSNDFKSLITNEGTFFKDGDTVIAEYTKDGSKQKDLSLFGEYKYGMDEITDTPMFVAQLYTNNGKEGFGHFYNGGDINE